MNIQQNKNNKSINKKIKYNKCKMNKNIIIVGAIAAGLYLLSQGKKTTKVVAKKKAPRRPLRKYPKPHPYLKKPKVKKIISKKKAIYNKPKIKRVIARKKAIYHIPKIKRVIARKKPLRRIIQKLRRR